MRGSTWWKQRNLERAFLILAGVVLGLLYFRLYDRNQQIFAEVPERLKAGTMVNINDPDAGQRMAALLRKGYYFGDSRDIAFAADAITRGLKEQPKPLDNIGELNKRGFGVSASDAFIKGGNSYRRRSQLSRYLIGFTTEDSMLYVQESKAPQSHPSSVNLGTGAHKIVTRIQNKEKAPVSGVLVRLALVIADDSLGETNSEDLPILITKQEGSVRKTFTQDSAKRLRLQGFVAYARTDANGTARFERLPDNQSFEVLPLQPGFEFGPSKGIQQLEDDEELAFVQSPHALRLFANRDFSNLKRERSLIVRMPEEVNYWFNIIGIAFLASFLLLHLFLTIRYPETDQLLLPVLMLLTGISLLTLLSLQDPLRDRFLGRSTLYYFLAGIASVIILLLIDFRKFTTDSRFYRFFVFRGGRSANGWPWAIVAACLLVLTILFGTGPEGSGVKVNLAGFQPSEVVKFLIIFFLAGYFATNETFIATYTRWQKRTSFFGFALGAILLTILLFLILGDLGPAMVTTFTFIVLFSFCRGDFPQMAGTVLLYVLVTWITKSVWIATGVTLLLLIIASFRTRFGLSESSIMVLVIMSGFMLLDQIPGLEKIIPGPMQRLTDRKAIWENPWNNEVFGGDHIANGIWGMTSGGISGQGIGEGFAKTIPEAHTDMILPSMGEELGLAGILTIFILFFLYLHRSIILGRQSGRPFLFYLTAGIGIATFVQFLLIAGGSIGALPLSGVSLPFMSYGGSSLILNMAAAGLLLSVSRVRGTVPQMKYVSAQHDRNLVPALAVSLVGIVLLGVSVGRYLLSNEKWVVQPSLVADRSGARIFSYNPRIAILIKRLKAGTLYDRNGLVLATSDPRIVAKQRGALAGLGLNTGRIDSMSKQRLDRYYPFGEQTFFWVGDMNSGAFMGSNNGYFAEYEHMADLRGFPAPEQSYQVRATRFHPSRFLPARTTEMSVRRRDFSALAPLLLAGINSKEVAEFKQQNRDVVMSVDASLQTRLNTALMSQTVAPGSRISIVVMDASNGDVLASAMNPLPALDNPEQMLLTPAEQSHLPYWVTNTDLGFTLATQPGSTAKLITALSAFNKLGMAATHVVKVVRPGDLIRRGGYEPDEAGPITIEAGIVHSNNPFFIRLANEEHLQDEMTEIYMKCGLFLRGLGGYYYGSSPDDAQRSRWLETWRNTEFKIPYNPNNIWSGRARGISGMAWGQGELVATPAAMARVASAIANGGSLLPNRYVIRIANADQPIKQGMAVAKDAQYAFLMTDYMRKQSAPKLGKLGILVAGKTGTPERISRNKQVSDGWYVFFAPKGNGPGNLVVCVRVEETKGSSIAVQLAGSIVVPMLRQAGYLRGFNEAPRATADVVPGFDNGMDPGMTPVQGITPSQAPTEAIDVAPVPAASESTSPPRPRPDRPRQTDAEPATPVETEPTTTPDTSR
jgi:cell division protein FtsW (lipid II flippase)/membrane peptidoglycan carboxypeptidase